MGGDLRAYVALLLFIPLAVAVLGGTRKPLAAVLALYLGGTLFLPEHAAIDFPVVPPFDKNAIVAMVALVGALALMRGKLRATSPFSGAGLAFGLVVIGNVGTWWTNTDPQIFGTQIELADGRTFGQQVFMPGLTPYDAVASVVRDTLNFFLPFYLGRALFRTREDAAVLLRGAVVFALVYVPLMLFEMRMSPQLHNWVYGYHANQFGHAARGSGFKPTVFLDNGLAVAMFVLAAILSAAVLAKAKQRVASLPALIPLGGLMLVLMLSRNVGAAIYAMVAVPAILLSRGKTAGRLAIVLVLVVVSYPSARASGVFPAQDLVEMATQLSPERAQSLNTRFKNEDTLYERASARLWFGWGGFGRSRIFDKFGKDVSITDGAWVIWLGGRGIFGFAGLFGMLLIPIVSARRKLKKVRWPQDRHMIDGLTLLCALNAVDLLPNGLFTKLPFLWAGALSGLAEGITRQSSEEAKHALARPRISGK